MHIIYQVQVQTYVISRGSTDNRGEELLGAMSTWLIWGDFLPDVLHPGRGPVLQL